MHLHFVCLGNICRSPMAEAIASEMYPHLKVSSSGCHKGGSKIDATANGALKMRGLDLSNHQPRSATSEILQSADLICCLEYRHLIEVRSIDPNCAERAFVLKELAANVSDVEALEDLDRLIKRLLEHPSGDSKYDVEDPWCEPIEQFLACAEEISEAISKLQILVS